MLATSVKDGLTNYLGGRSSNLATVNNVYVALSTTEPTAAGGNVTEPVGNGYARALLGSYSQSLTLLMSVPNNGVSRNSKAVKFDEATGNWGVVTHIALYSAETGGTFLASAPLSAPITPTSGKMPTIRINGLTISTT